MPKVIALAYGGGHINALLPVLRRLRERKDVDLRVFALTTAKSVAERAGLEAFGFRNLADASDRRVQRYGRLLGKAVAGGGVDVEETTAYLGLSYREMTQRLGSREARNLYRRRGRQAFLPRGVMAELLEGEKPDLVLATNAPRAEQALILEARKAGIKAICVVDLFASHEVRWIGNQGYADRICVLSDYVRDHVIRSGRKPHEVIVTGNPAFDALADPGLVDDGRRIRAEREWGERPVILWASQPDPVDPELPRIVDERLFEIMRSHPEWELVIRPHPSENLTYDGLPSNISLSDQTDDLGAILHAVDVVLTISSTVGLQAVLCDRPVVALGMSALTQYAPYAEMGLARGVDDFADLEQAIEEVLLGGWRPSGSIPLAGNATERVMEVIDQVLAARIGLDPC